jgi:hypothetical protein
VRPLITLTFKSLQVKFAEENKLVALNQNKYIGIVPHYMMSLLTLVTHDAACLRESHLIRQLFALSLM